MQRRSFFGAIAGAIGLGSVKAVESKPQHFTPVVMHPRKIEVIYSSDGFAVEAGEYIQPGYLIFVADFDGKAYMWKKAP